jgi:hypothetical protein
MKFRAYVEPPEPMRGLEVPPEVVDALGGGKRPPVTIRSTGIHGRAESPSCVAATCLASATPTDKLPVSGPAKRSRLM